MICDLKLPHDYQLAELEELQNGFDIHYFSESNSGEGGNVGVIIKMTSSAMKSWLGVFAFGMGAFSGVYAMPGKRTFCVVSKGNGYIVSVDQPESFKIVECDPVTDVKVSTEHNIVIFASYTELVAYGEIGLLWRSDRLAFDGLRITNVDGDFILGKYFDLRSEKMEKFSVNLSDGTHTGSQPPILW